MTKDTGGPAFPVDPTVRIDIDSDWCGMTLRDYFAAKAMQTLLAARCFPMDVDIPRYAYEVADMMLVERAK